MAHQLQIDNYRITYCLEGNPNYPAILFLHGFMGDRHEFQQVIANLSKQFYCVAIDLLGHGSTYCSNQNKDRQPNQADDQVIDQDYYYTIQPTANLIIDFLDFLHLDHCFLVGYSMGGRLGLYLAMHFPKYFHKVVLESASAGLCTANERSDRLAKDRELAAELENGDFRIFLEKWYQQSIFASLRSHRNFPQLLEQRLQNSPSQLAKSLRNLSTGIQPSLWENLTEINIPLLLLAGALDSKFVEINQQMEHLCKFAQLQIIPNCGHNIHFENPDLFSKQVENFFKI